MLETMSCTTEPVYIQYTQTDFNGPQLVAALRQQGYPANLLKFNDKAQQHDLTYISLHQRFTLTLKNHRLIQTTPDHQSHVLDQSLHEVVSACLARFKTPQQPDLPPFFGGFIGYFSYDYARYVESTLPQQVPDPYDLADADLSFVDQVLSYDHQTHILTLSQLCQTTPKARQAAYQALQILKQRLATLRPTTAPIFKLTTPFTLAFDRPTFYQKLAQAKQHIAAGDIFQLILANRQHARCQGTLLGISAAFFKQEPTPYQFYYRHGDFEAIGASPETLITKTGPQLFTYPLAGTRRRGHDDAEDQRFSQELQTAPKEISEHNMLVDLGRNDLGRISTFGSVQVTKLRQLLKFQQVMHLGSTIESTVAPDVTSMAIVEALLPAGTLSGAPKIEAMTLIQQLEQQKRGLYGGCLGYLGVDGNLDLCIGIRLAYRKGADLFVHSGAGIVADSQPAQEYLEFNNKARGVLSALTRRGVV